MTSFLYIKEGKCCTAFVRVLGVVADMPWKKQKTRLKMNKERCVVLLLGGSFYDESPGAVTIVHHGRRRDDESRRTKKDIEKDNFLWERDFRALSTLFERTGAQVWRSIPTALHCSKSDTIETILSFLTYDDCERQQKGMSYEQAITFIIYWCGHGQPLTGNWHFSDDEWITCSELIDLWKAVDRSDRDALTIISDSCFSGAWIDELQTKQIPNLAYQAACRSDETAWVVDDRDVPRSLLMRRFFLEFIEEKTDNSENLVYAWTCPSQHPVFVCSYIAEEDEKQEMTETRAIVRGGLSFFTVHKHMNMDENYYAAESNGTVRHGKFLKITRK